MGLAGSLPASAAEENAAVSGVSFDDPMTLVVSIERQRAELYLGHTLMSSTRVSTGRRGHATPTGVFSILGKRRYHESNIYSRAPMPYMQRLTWSGIALHAGRVPNYRASHGCIRLPDRYARELFGITKMGIHVVIARDEAEIVPIAHANLFQPPSLVAPPPRTASAANVVEISNDGQAYGLHRPDGNGMDFEAVVPQAGGYTLRSTTPLRVLITRRTGRERVKDAQRLLNELGYEAGELDGYMGPNTGKAILAFQRANDLRATGGYSDDVYEALHEAVGRPVPSGHIYVRRDYLDVFDAPIEFTDPERPLGTHMYTVMDFVHDGAEARWIGTTVEPAAGTDMVDALDRVVLPDELRARIADMLSPGSSVVISDHGISKETGKGTDFIVLTR